MELIKYIFMLHSQWFPLTDWSGVCRTGVINMITFSNFLQVIAIIKHKHDVITFHLMWEDTSEKLNVNVQMCWI